MASLPAIDIRVFKRPVRGGTVLEARAFAPDGRPLPVTKRCLIREHVEGDFLRAHGPWGLSEVIRFPAATLRTSGAVPRRAVERSLHDQLSSPGTAGDLILRGSRRRARSAQRG
jgi:hypothetical protein